MWTLQLLTVVALTLAAWAQDNDPQAIAEIACASSDSVYEFTNSSGYIESLNFPLPYENNEACEWYINPDGGIPEGQHLFLEVVTFNIESGYDYLRIFEGEASDGNLLFVLDGQENEGVYYDLGTSSASLIFTTDSSVTYQGFRLYFYVGELSPGQQVAQVACNETTRPAVFTNNVTSLIESPGYPGGHEANIECEWFINPGLTPDGLYIGVIFFSTYNDLQIFYSGNTTGEADDTLNGQYDNGYTLYAPSSEITLLYDVLVPDNGFKLVSFPADSACLSGAGRIIPVTENGGLTSPGYPFVIPEHLSCRWYLEAEAGQKVTISSVDMDIRGDVDGECQDEYVEIFDGSDHNALSLGRFCGEQSFDTLASTGEVLQVYFRSHDNPIGNRRTGFLFTYGTS